MTKLQNPNIPTPTVAIEIDKAIYELQLKMDSKLAWLSHDYGRAYRHIDKANKRLYFPEIYIGGDKTAYYRVTPDNDKKGMCFFVVGKENSDFDQFHYNFLQWKVGIVFSANLDKISKATLSTEIFTQNLIRDVREVLTRSLGGLSFTLEINDVVTEFNEIYKEFRLEEEEGYLRSPQTGFRFNCTITLQEDCVEYFIDPTEALISNFSPEEKRTILSNVDFSDDENFNALTPQQINDLTARL